MASAYPTPAMLRVKRSSQCGNYTMTVAWQTVFAQNHLYAWMFASGKVNLSNMILGDHIEIRVSTRDTLAGGFIVQDLFDYDDAQPTNKQKVVIGSILDTFGVLVEMRQTVGALIQCYCEFYDATR